MIFFYIFYARSRSGINFLLFFVRSMPSFNLFFGRPPKTNSNTYSAHDGSVRGRFGLTIRFSTNVFVNLEDQHLAVQDPQINKTDPRWNRKYKSFIV